MNPEMREKFIKNRVNVPPGLLAKVMNRLEAEKNLVVLRRRFFWAGSWLVVSSAAFVLVTRLFWLDLAASGFGQYASLVFSDFSYILADWRNYALSLLETLPALSAVVLLVSVLALLYGLKQTLTFGRELKKSMQQASLINN